MNTDTRLIQPASTQIQPILAQGVRTDAETARTFAEVLDSQADAREPETNDSKSAASTSTDDEQPDTEPVSTDKPQNEGDAEPAQEDSTSATVEPGASEASGSSVVAADSSGPVVDKPVAVDEGEGAKQDTNHEGRPVVSHEQSAPAADSLVQSEQGAQVGRVEQDVPPPDALVALSRQAEQAKHQIQEVTRELTHAATVNVAKIAREELGTNTNLGALKESVAGDEPETTFGASFKQRFAWVKDEAGSGSPEQQEKARQVVHEKVMQSQSLPSKLPNVSVDPAVRAQPSVVQSAVAVAHAVPAAMPEVMRPTLDRIQNVRSMISGLPAVAAVGTGSSPASVAAASPVVGNTIGPDAGAAGKLGVLRQTIQTGGSDRSAVIAQVQKGLASILRTGGGSMTIRLRPDHLGELKIRVDTEQGGIRARFETQTEGARESIESGLKSLREHLESKGVRVDELRVDHRQGGSANSNGQGLSDQEKQHSGRSHDERSTESHAASTENTNEPEHDQSTGIWTELGLDAVA